NYLTEVPKWIGELKELRTLFLAYNPLKLLPDSLENLRNLETLAIAESTAVSRVIGSLGGLKHLGIVNAGLRAMPVWVRKLRGLKTLLLSNNMLVEIPNWISE